MGLIVNNNGARLEQYKRAENKRAGIALIPKVSHCTVRICIKAQQATKARLYKAIREPNRA